MQIKPLLPPVTVNGVTLDPARIAAEAQNHPAPKGKPGAAWKAAARALTIRELLLQEATRRNICAAPAEVAPGQWETDEEARISALLDTAVVPEAADSVKLRRIYDANPEQFRAPSLYEAAHILLPASADDPAAVAQAQETAKLLIKHLAQAPRDFAKLAAQYSACSSKTSGGVLGQLSSGDTVAEFEMAMAQMKEGSISAAPVRSRYGLHIIRLDARMQGQVLPFEAVLPHLKEAHEKVAWLRACHAFISRLVSTAEVIGLEFDNHSKSIAALQGG